MEEPIRVLHILQRMEAAGIQTFLMNIYRKIDRKKIQFDFLVHYKEDEFYDNEIRELGGRIYKFSVREDFNLLRYRKDIRSFFETHKEYKVVHGHMETLSNIWEDEANRAGIPMIIAHSHTAGFNEKNKLKLFVKEFFRRCYGKHAHMRLACSKAAGDFMFRGASYELVYNATDIEKFRFSEEKRNIRRKLGLKDEFVIGHVGRFHPSKNHKFIIEIAIELRKILPNVKVLLAGEGDLFNEIKKEIEEKCLDYIVLLGNRSDVDYIYSAMDAFVMPSLFEGLPLVGIEAQASGLPCYFSSSITDELGVTDLAHFISLEKDAKYWAEKISESIKINTNRTQYADIVGNYGYDINVLISNLIGLYKEVYK